MATTTRVLTASVNGTVYTTNANGALEAIDTCHSGATAPTDEVANGKLWLDTTTTPGILKMYNNAAWEEIGGSTSSPTFANGTFTGDVAIGDGLAVDGDAVVQGSEPRFILSETDVTGQNTRFRNSGGDLQIQTINDAYSVATNRISLDHATGDVRFYEDTGTTADFLWDASASSLTVAGDVGIGVAPSSALHLGDGAVNDAAEKTTEIVVTSSDPSWVGAGAGMKVVRTWLSTSWLKFMVSSGGGRSTAMTIDSSGNVGIGTSAPTLPLHVYNGSSATLASFESGNATSRIIIKNGTATYGSYLMDVGDALTLATNAVERLRINSSGHVLMGGTAASNSTSMIYLRPASSSGFINSGANALTVGRNTNDGAAVAFLREGTTVGSISVTTSATAYNTSSDYRLKENVTPIQGAADTVMAMQPCTYTAIADGVWYDGFLAHELQEVHPRAVQGTKDAMMDEEYEVTPAVYEDVVTPAVDAVAATYDDDGLELTPAVEAAPETTESVLVTEAVMGTRSVPDMQSVDYSKLTPILTAALQEALAKIEAMEVRLAALEV